MSLWVPVKVTRPESDRGRPHDLNGMIVCVRVWHQNEGYVEAWGELAKYLCILIIINVLNRQQTGYTKRSGLLLFPTCIVCERPEAGLFSSKADVLCARIWLACLRCCRFSLLLLSWKVLRNYVICFFKTVARPVNAWNWTLACFTCYYVQWNTTDQAFLRSD
jgi:hypothetical protein